MLFKDKNDNTIQVDPLRRLILVGMFASSSSSKPRFWNDKNINDISNPGILQELRKYKPKK